jgi:hypothetical protein
MLTLSVSKKINRFTQHVQCKNLNQNLKSTLFEDIYMYLRAMRFMVITTSYVKIRILILMPKDIVCVNIAINCVTVHDKESESTRSCQNPQELK